jgi:imidazolonepropionase-like amidohydrolase
MLDLGSATVLPGMIDTHVHVNTGGNTQAQRALRALANAQIDLAVGFTAVLDMDSRGSFYTVDLRDAINSGIVQGPRMQVVGQSINQRATNYYPDAHSVRFYDGFTEGKNVNSPWLARTAVREAKLHGVDYIKIYTTQDFAGTVHMWKPDATLVNSPSLTLEEVEAIVEEAHRLGLKVACHAYGGATNWNVMSKTTGVIDFPNVMSKFIMFGMPLSQIIACATINAARVFPSFDDRGTLNVGAPADVAMLELREGTFEFLDNYKGTRTGHQRLFPAGTVLAGKQVQRA